MKNIILLVATGLSFATASLADDQVLAGSGEAYKGNYSIDTGLPSVPAFEVIGFKSDGVVGTPLGADWYFDVAPDGDSGASLALNFKPFWIFGGMTLDKYQTDSVPDGKYKITGRGILARTQVSLASNHDEGGHPQLGIGLQTSLLGNNDPRLNKVYTGCLNDIPAPEVTRPSIPSALYPTLRENFSKRLKDTSLAADSARILAALDETLKDFPDNARLIAIERAMSRKLSLSEADAEELGSALVESSARLEPAPTFKVDDSAREACIAKLKADPARQDWYVGIGEAYASPDTSYSNFKSQGASAWMGYQRKLNDKGNFTLFYRMLPGQTIEYAKDQEAEARVGIYALKLDYQTPKWTAELTLSQNDRNYRDPLLEDVSFQRYSVSFSHKVTEKIWIVFEQGEVSEDLYNDGSYSLLSLRYVGE